MSCIVETLHASDKLIALTGMTLQTSEITVKINGQLSEYFNVRMGLRQGDCLSALLFNVALEKVIRQANINSGGIYHKRLLSSQEVWKKYERLVINEDKTKYMTCREGAFV